MKPASGIMRARDVLLYQLGQREAIEQAARNQRLPVIGVILVLITSVPRNYDQTYLGAVPWWPVIPLAFSFFSGAFVYSILARAFIRGVMKTENEGRGFFLQFLGLFWLTAPIAWLYGIPVERFLEPRGATVASSSRSITSAAASTAAEPIASSKYAASGSPSARPLRDGRKSVAAGDCGVVADRPAFAGARGLVQSFGGARSHRSAAGGVD